MWQVAIVAIEVVRHMPNMMLPNLMRFTNFRTFLPEALTNHLIHELNTTNLIYLRLKKYKNRFRKNAVSVLKIQKLI